MTTDHRVGVGKGTVFTACLLCIGCISADVTIANKRQPRPERPPLERIEFSQVFVGPNSATVSAYVLEPLEYEKLMANWAKAREYVHQLESAPVWMEER